MDEEHLKRLYHSLTSTVWVLQIPGYGVNGNYKKAPVTAFGVKKEGVLLTCSHGWDNYKQVELIAKCLNSDVSYPAHVLHRLDSCDMVFVSVDGLEDEIECVSFGSSCLDVGDGVMVIGHPHHWAGLGMVGRVTYPTFAKPLFCPDDSLTWSRYRTTDPERKDLSHILRPNLLYRVMGHVWNAEIFSAVDNNPHDDRNLEFEQNLIANLSIIMSCGLVCGEGSSGGPLFNMKCEAVGMHVMGICRHEVAIHVSVLEYFLNKLHQPEASTCLRRRKEWKFRTLGIQ